MIFYIIFIRRKKEAHFKFSITQVNNQQFTRHCIYPNKGRIYTKEFYLCRYQCMPDKRQRPSSHDESFHPTPTTSKFKIHKLENFNLALDVSCKSEQIIFSFPEIPSAYTAHRHIGFAHPKYTLPCSE